MKKTIEDARNEFIDWYNFLILTRGNPQVARLFIDSGLEYDRLLAQENEWEME